MATMTNPIDATSPDAIKQDRLWRDNGWTARVIKNNDDDGWAVEMIKDGEPGQRGVQHLGENRR